MGGCRAVFGYGGAEIPCGEGGLKQNLYTCNLPLVVPADTPGKLDPLEIEAISEEIMGGIIWAQDELGDAYTLDATPPAVSEDFTPYCGYPQTKIKMRQQDITKTFSHVWSTCECETMCSGEGAWMVNLQKGKCFCRELTE